jgi:hypothetical protein
MPRAVGAQAQAAPSENIQNDVSARLESAGIVQTRSSRFFLVLLR